MGNVELERTSYIGFVSGKYSENIFDNIFCGVGISTSLIVVLHDTLYYITNVEVTSL
jgi:hypothetical protein